MGWTPYLVLSSRVAEGNLVARAPNHPHVQPLAAVILHRGPGRVGSNAPAITSQGFPNQGRCVVSMMKQTLLGVAMALAIVGYCVAVWYYVVRSIW